MKHIHKEIAFIHSSADGYVGCFHVLAIINSAAMDTGVHVSLSDLVSSVCMPGVGLLGHMTVLFPLFLRNLHTALHSGYTSFHSHQQCKMFRENSIKTSILSRVKQITSPGWMHETGAQGWCTGKTQKDGIEREAGGGIRMENTCKSMADSCQCMAKTTTIL